MPAWRINQAKSRMTRRGEWFFCNCGLTQLSGLPGTILNWRWLFSKPLRQRLTQAGAPRTPRSRREFKIRHYLKCEQNEEAGKIARLRYFQPLLN